MYVAIHLMHVHIRVLHVSLAYPLNASPGVSSSCLFLLMSFSIFPSQTTDSLVNKRRLGAFNITKDRVRFASTLELRLASLGLWKACRGFPALRVWVEEETSPTLRSCVAGVHAAAVVGGADSISPSAPMGGLTLVPF